MIDLSGRTALVTGASRGIGRAIAEALMKAGADVIGLGTRFDGGDHPEGMIRQECDLSDRSEIRAALAALQNSRVDILVNNAGIIRRAALTEHRLEDWDDVLAINLDAPFILSQALGSKMAARGYGKIVNVTSVLASQGGILVPGYAASKAGLANLTRASANEWASLGVNVNAVAPGYVSTDNTAALQADRDREAALLDRVPLGRWLTPEEIAAPVVFLASDAASAIHGAILPIDGGWSGR